MTLQIDMNDEIGVVEESIQQLITDLLQHAAKEERLPGDTEVSMTFMSDEGIQEVNQTYRGIDAPTDVISFALEEMGEGEMAIFIEGMPTILGDIIIAVPTAKRQAEEYGHSFKREMGFLALHGFLHLLGYDHMTEPDEKKMFGRQEEILHSFGLQRS